LIASPCPVVVSLIERHYPHLIKFLMPTVSPLVATGRYLLENDPTPSIKVFIGPCIAKKEEIQDPQLKGVIDHALTYREVKEMFKARAIDPAKLHGMPADPPHPGQGRVFPLVGGILKTAGMGTDILDDRIAIIEGHHETLEFLRTFDENHPPRCDFVDILFCRGCIDGVEMDSELSHLDKHRKVCEFVSESRHLNPSSLPEVNLKRPYQDRKLRTMEPTAEEITEILRMFGKHKPEDELNCGACGYRTCREKARAVFQGIAEPEMCLPEIIKQLEKTVVDLNISHEELKKAQDELVHSEKLASLGQLSAGVAHELNNPLGGILLFSNMLQEKLAQIGKDTLPEEIDIIVKEATRCRNIVRGLLDFARQSKLQKTRIDIGELLAEISTIERRAAPQGVQFVEEYDPALPPTMLDPVQIRQALTNIIHNAVEAMPQGGTLKIVTRHSALTQTAEITIADSGVGIPDNSISKLFTPFFTTKGVGKGTGLGLAICYGIIKMHRGSINVQSSVGKGTTFNISLPLESPPEETVIGGPAPHGSGGR
ncbi:MAG TPA: [Fe-Fe] hydrogenase large subunit C-terminal domain-containing protein, partial [Candidatus Ozemobacteraceae bacterium]|nr:[Fe-Fe] hydrogenase large subunit C-terminal domain-containing protein [Candidatus Ozemobacteraceae bacterium]